MNEQLEICFCGGVAIPYGQKNSHVLYICQHCKLEYTKKVKQSKQPKQPKRIK
jgi:hypothetical protein